MWATCHVLWPTKWLSEQVDEIESQKNFKSTNIPSNICHTVLELSKLANTEAVASPAHGPTALRLAAICSYLGVPWFKDSRPWWCQKLYPKRLPKLTSCWPVSHVARARWASKSLGMRIHRFKKHQHHATSLRIDILEEKIGATAITSIKSEFRGKSILFQAFPSKVS